MQIVIDIDEELYDTIQYELHWDKVLEQNDIRNLLLAVDGGVVIPSGHGRIVDESQIRSWGWDFINHHAKTDTPTIIESDKGE